MPNQTCLQRRAGVRARGANSGYGQPKGGRKGGRNPSIIIVLGAVDNALKLSHKAHLKDFKLAGYHESFVRQIAQDRSAEFKALLPWLNHFSNKLNNVGQQTQFIHLVSQLQIILPQINCIHQYNFDDYKLLLTMAGDFSPLLNHLQKRTQTVFAN